MLACAQQLTGVGGWTWEVAEPPFPAFNDKALRWTEETLPHLRPGPRGHHAPRGCSSRPSTGRPPADPRQAGSGCGAAALPDAAPHPPPTARCGSSRIPSGTAMAGSAASSARSVTERRLAEAALADDAARLQDLLSNLDLAAAMARDVDGTIRFWSKGCEPTLDRAEAMGRNAHALLGARLPGPAGDRGGCATGAGGCGIAAGMARRWWWRSTRCRRDAAGRTIAVVESVADVTALAVRRGRRWARLRSVVDSALDSMVGVATQRRGGLANEQRQGCSAVRAAALVGQDLGVLALPAEEAARHGARLAGMAAPGGAGDGARPRADRAPRRWRRIPDRGLGRRLRRRRPPLRHRHPARHSSRVAERALAESEARLRTIVDTSKMALVPARYPFDEYVLLTRSAKGEAGAAFTASGDVLFVSARPDADADADDESGQLWLLPAGGGEARPVTRLAGGVGADRRRPPRQRPGRHRRRAAARRRHARGRGEAAQAPQGQEGLGDPARGLPGAVLGPRSRSCRAAPARDRAGRPRGHDRRGRRRVARPRRMPRLPTTRNPTTRVPGCRRRRGRRLAVPRDPAPPARPDARAPAHRRPRPGRALAGRRDRRSPRCASPSSGTDDSRSPRSTPDAARAPRSSTRRTSTSRRRRSATTARRIAYLRTPKSSPAGPADVELWIAGIDGADPRRIAEDWDRWATSFQFDADDAALIATADSDGRGPVYRIPLDGAAPEQLTHDDFTYTHVAVDRGTGDLVALRSSGSRRRTRCASPATAR